MQFRLCGSAVYVCPDCCGKSRSGAVIFCLFVGLVNCAIELLERARSGGTPQLFLVLEMVGDQRMVHTGTLGNIAR